jgi:hypothetical protein
MKEAAMGRTYDTLDAGQIEWIDRQPLFFIATAPTAADGLVNVSPKGGRGSLRVLGPSTVAYLDLTGSGIETIAHLRENGRIVLMFCAFEGPPKILRLHGRGRVMTNESEEWQKLLARFAPSDDVLHLLRSIVVVEVTRIGDSCGFVVPRMDFVEDRRHLFKWARNREEQHGPDWKTRYHQANNRLSLDGLPGLPTTLEMADADLERLSSDGRAL